MMEIREHCLLTAKQAINNKQYPQAHQALVQAIRQTGDFEEAYFLLGIIHIELMQISKAAALLEKAVSLGGTAKTYVYLAKCYALQGNMTEAKAAAANAPVSALDDALSLDTAGVALSRAGDHHTALNYFEKALQLAPDNPAFYYNTGVSAKFAGDFGRAKETFETAIRLAPAYSQAHFALSDLETSPDNPDRIAALEALDARLAERQPPDIDGRLHVAHALAKEWEAKKEYGEAFTLLKRAKSEKLATLPRHDSDFSAVFDMLERIDLEPPVNTQPVTGRHTPLFVTGMPRSGTTLAERILSNHTRVASGGELQDFGVSVKEIVRTPSQVVLDAETLIKGMQADSAAMGNRYLERTAHLNGGKPYLVDKLPFNFFYIPLIRKALPQARIVCMLRHPMDTCTGNFRQLFSINSPYYSYAYDIDTIGRVYTRFYHLMLRWAKQAPDQIYLQSYEALVTDPAGEIKKLLGFCGLPWEEKCLHVEQNDNPVSTASKVQVREAINAKSVGNWRRYETHLTDLAAQFEKNGVPY